MQQLCPRCQKNKIETHPVFGVVNCEECNQETRKSRCNAHNDFFSSNGELHSTTHTKQIHTRCVDDDGKSISGKAGLSYMKKNPGKYVGRLKGYYNS